MADFHKDNGRAIRRVCARFIVLCRSLRLFTEASVAIDGLIMIRVKRSNFDTYPQWPVKPRRAENCRPATVYCRGSGRVHFLHGPFAALLVRMAAFPVAIVPLRLSHPAKQNIFGTAS
jgi:hypothetical protein